MALWDRINSRGNVEDRRSMAPVVGGVGLTGVALYVIFSVLTGGEVDVGTVLNELQQSQVVQQPQNSEEFAGADEYEVFASTVLGSNNELWSQLFSEKNQDYNAPRLVLFRTATSSACGTATLQVGPHYCSLDETIYLDETFFEELQSRFGAQGGDLAEAYVIAHEVGHHVQYELGLLENRDSIEVELQADCFAGLWANSIRELGVIQPGEIQEAMDAAAAVGDDRIQQSVTGQVNPETWTHGSSEQRVFWFNRGYESGSFDQCNTSS